LKYSPFQRGKKPPFLALFNRTHVTVPLTGQLFGVFFLGGHISLKNRS
jgi:hypothetical protein